MSVRTMALVWEHSRHAGNDLLMLLAIADNANDEGVAWPSVPMLARKCRMTPRNVNLILAELRRGGEITIEQNAGPKGTNLYTIRLPLKESSALKDASALKVSSATPEETFPKPLKKPSDEPSVNHQEPSESVRAAAHTARAPRFAKPATSKITFDTFAERCKTAGQKLLAENDPIFDWADDAGLPEEWLRLAWIEFRNRYRGNAKRYADWPQVFRNAVRNNWYSLWRLEAGGEYALTTQGEMARRAAEASDRRPRDEVAA